MTNRRAFLAAILGAPAALALDPERLLWRPGAKLISVPAPRGNPIIFRYVEQDIHRFFQDSQPFPLRRGETITFRKPQRFGDFREGCSPTTKGKYDR